MGKETGITWCDHTFNIWWGCSKVSAGCANCYAETWSKRTGFEIWGKDAPRRFFGQKHWNEPLAWNWLGGRRRVFCSSMADVFETHANPLYQAEMDKERKHLAWTIEKTANLDWLLLTKRIEDADRYLSQMFPGGSPDNLWLGTTVENPATEWRIKTLLEIPAKIHFLSIEPMLGPVFVKQNEPCLDCDAMILEHRKHGTLFDDHERLDPPIDWVIYGCESGPKRRPCNPAWIRDGLAQCRAAGVAAFVKQIEVNGQVSKDPTEWPDDLRVQEFPQTVL